MPLIKSRLKNLPLPELQQIAAALGVSAAQPRNHLVTAIASIPNPQTLLPAEQWQQLGKPAAPPSGGHKVFSALISVEVHDRIAATPGTTHSRFLKEAIAAYLTYLESHPPTQPVPPPHPGRTIRAKLPPTTHDRVTAALNGWGYASFARQAIAFYLDQLP